MTPRSVFGLWSDISAGKLNRLLRPYGVRLVVQSKSAWGDQLLVSAEPIVEARPAEHGKEVAP